MRLGMSMADDLHELSALYALDALDAGDRARYEAHLDECARSRDDVASFRETAASLALLPEGQAPPDALRARVLDAVRAERQNVVPLRPRRALPVWAAAGFAVAATAAA